MDMGSQCFGLFPEKDDAVKWLKENGWKRNCYCTKKVPVYHKKRKSGAIVMVSVLKHKDTSEIPDIF